MGRYLLRFIGDQSLRKNVSIRWTLLLILLRLPEGIAFLDTGDLIETDGAFLMGQGSLNTLLGKGFSLPCLKLRFVDLQLGLLALSVAETFDGLVGVVRKFFEGLTRGDVLFLVEKRNQLSNGGIVCDWNDGISWSFIETGRALGLSGC